MKKTLLIIGLIVLFMSGCDLDIPIAPVVLATPLSTSSIYVTWWSVSAATSYDVYYRKGSDPIQFLVNTTQTSYTHSGLTRDTQYTYCVKSKNSNGESSFSLDAPARTFANPTGSSRIDAITITSTGVDGTLILASSELWYTFTGNGQGTLSASDNGNSGTPPSYTADIVVDILDSSEQVITINSELMSGINIGYNNRDSISHNWGDGIYYVKVKLYNALTGGTFKITFTDSP